MYYGAADTCLALAIGTLNDLLDWLKNAPAIPSAAHRNCPPVWRVKHPLFAGVS